MAECPETSSRDSEVPAEGGEIQQRDDKIIEFISALATKNWIGLQHLHKYKGFWFSTDMLRAFIAEQHQVEPKENDVLLATMPKSGTVWLKALLFALLNRKIHPINQNHPLLAHNPHTLVPFINFQNPSEFWSSLPPIRLYATHLPRELLPVEAKCKIVYLCRNLKDVFVSYWHFFKKSADSESKSSISLEETFESFCEGISLYGPVWDHVLGYWKESLEKPERVMFLRYEEMKEDPMIQVKRMAAFVGSPITGEEEQKGLVDEILRLCSFDHLRNLDVNKNGKWWAGTNQDFFRKGEVGDWKNHLTEEMAHRLDRITEHKLQGSGLKL